MDISSPTRDQHTTRLPVEPDEANEEQGGAVGSEPRVPVVHVCRHSWSRLRGEIGVWPNRVKHAVFGFWLLTAACFAGGLALLLWYTPDSATMGPAQKIFYIHLPVAICTFLAAAVVFVASVGFLWQRSIWWDDLAAAGGRVTVLLCSVVLLTGMVWGKSEWGQWWSWSPPLTFSLVLWVLYLGYLLVRPCISSATRRATISSIYGIAVFLNVPLVYISVKLMPDIHPSSMMLSSEMRLTLLVWFVPVTMLAGGLLMARYRLNRRIRNFKNQASEPNIPDRLIGGVS